MGSRGCISANPVGLFGVFFVGVSRKELKSAKRKGSQCLKLLRTHRQAVSAVADEQNGHNNVGQTRKSQMTCNDFSARQQKQLIKAWGYTVRYAVPLGNPSKSPWTCLQLFVKSLESEEGWKSVCARICKAFGSPQVFSVVFSWIVLNTLGMSGAKGNSQNLTFGEYLAF